MLEKEDWIKSSLVFEGVTGYALSSLQRYVTLNQADKKNYKIFRLCLYVGLNLNSRERGNLIDIKEHIMSMDNNSKKFHIPAYILLNSEIEVKRLLFSTFCIEHITEINIHDLQEKWNSPSLNNGDEVFDQMCKYVENGSLYLYDLFVVTEHKIPKINEIILDICNRETKGWKLKEKEKSYFSELGITEDTNSIIGI